MDNLPVHRLAKVRPWLGDKADCIQLCYLPPYAPQLNIDEWLNHDLETELRSRVVAKDMHTLTAMTLAFMHKLISVSDRVRRYFQSQSTAYTSASTLGVI